MKNRCSFKGCQVADHPIRYDSPLDYENQFSGYREEIDQKTREQSSMAVNCMVKLALCVVARELTKFCWRYDAVGFVLIEGELVRGAPCKYRKSEQQNEQTTRRPKS